ncbi:MAG: hypothetical protein HZC02_02775 [Candidatus Levybacteria bacterium]|nr:hypothetical protein [Candidatus Levybacteria bacterium]
MGNKKIPRFVFLIAIVAIALGMAGFSSAQAQDTSTPPASPVTCPADSWAQAAIGQNVVFLGTEPCTWTWRSAPNDVQLTCPADFVCTIDEGGDLPVTVQNGNGQTVMGDGGTFRYKPSFPAGDAVWDVCALYPKEVEFGKWADYPNNTRARDPQFDVYYRPVLTSDPATCGDGTLLAAPLSGTTEGGTNGATDTGSGNTLNVTTVASWCTPDCSGRLEQLVESDGNPNPAGVKLKAGDSCFQMNVPDGYTFEIWDGTATVTGQTATMVANACEGSIRKIATRSS